MRRIIVTGSKGFIGSHFVRHILRNPDVIVYGIDIELEPSGSRFFTDETKQMYPRNYITLKEDIRNRARIFDLVSLIQPDVLYNFAAETHVCRSNRNADDFVTTNVLGTNVLLDQVKTNCPTCRFVHISTDEVYGTLGYDDDPWVETHRYEPNNPYAVTKAASNMMVLSYVRNYGIDAVITAASNTYGPNQYFEKLIPKIINHIHNRENIPIHGSGEYLREWLYVEDHVHAIELIGTHGIKGEKYNIGGYVELQNKDVAKMVLDEVRLQSGQKIYSQLVHVEDRPFNDKRYALDDTKLMNLTGWQATTDFQTGLKKTVKWYLANKNRMWDSK